MRRIIARVLKIYLPMYLILYIAGISIMYHLFEIPKDYSEYLYESLFAYNHILMILAIAGVDVLHHRIKNL